MFVYFLVSQASSTGRHGSTDCTVPGAASLADLKVNEHFILSLLYYASLVQWYNALSVSLSKYANFKNI